LDVPVSLRLIKASIFFNRSTESIRFISINSHGFTSNSGYAVWPRRLLISYRRDLTGFCLSVN
jgi:hypothetical protein